MVFIWTIRNAESLLTRICTCSEYRISWKLKTSHVAPFATADVWRIMCLCEKVRLLQCILLSSLPLCFLAYKTRHQGQTSGLMSEASGSLGGDSFRFFWQVITEPLWWKSCCTIVTTFPLFFFFQRLHLLDGNYFCVPLLLEFRGNTGW